MVTDFSWEVIILNFNMSNYKSILFLLFAALLFAGCGTPVYTFRTKDIITDSMRKNVSAFIDPEVKDPIASYTAFKAEIKETLVESNAVAEYKLVNSLSGKKTIDLAINRYRNELYFYEFQSINEQEYGIYLAATFETAGAATRRCIGLGPLYIGHIGVGENGSKKFITVHEYTIKKKRCSSRLIVKKKKNPQLLDFLYMPVLNKEGDPIEIKVFQIIQKNKNKISGLNKPLVYDITRIFNDPDALAFSIFNEQ